METSWLCFKIHGMVGCDDSHFDGIEGEKRMRDKQWTRNPSSLWMNKHNNNKTMILNVFDLTFVEMERELVFEFVWT